ncbi:MAG: DUF4402 domain-containing protein [Chitinophagaceae bacterium]
MKKFLPISLLVVVLGLISLNASAQGDPTDTIPGDPGAIAVYTIQNLSFGAFTPGSSGGTVIISNAGNRSVTGDVIPLNLGHTYFHTIFEVDAPEGSIISIINGSDINLAGSNGGSLSLKIGNSDPPSPFFITVPQPSRTQINIGGTLTVGSQAVNPPGTYTGTFYITFNQE